MRIVTATLSTFPEPLIYPGARIRLVVDWSWPWIERWFFPTSPAHGKTGIVSSSPSIVASHAYLDHPVAGDTTGSRIRDFRRGASFCRLRFDLGSESVECPFNPFHLTSLRAFPVLSVFSSHPHPNCVPSQSQPRA